MIARFASAAARDRVAAVGRAVQEHLLRAVEHRVDHRVARDHAAERHVARRDAFRERDDVRLQPVARGAEIFAEPAEPADHFVGDEQHAVPVADVAQSGCIAGRRRQAAARVLQRLDDDRGDGIRPFLHDQRFDLVEQVARELRFRLARRAAVALRVAHVPHTRHQRLEMLAEVRHPVQRKRAERRAVIRDAPRDELAPLRLAARLVILAHQLDRRFVRLRAARREEHAVQPFRRERRELVRELDRRLVAHPSWSRTAAAPSARGSRRRFPRRGCSRPARSTARPARRSSACRCGRRASSLRRGRTR